MNQLIAGDTAARLLQTIRKTSTPFHYEQEKHRIVLSNQTGDELLHFRLPITMPAPNRLTTPEAQAVAGVNYIILLIQSGSCAIGYFENGVNLDHKVFRAYMVRKKQGKSQIKHLKTKGKSRAGSRVRLAETLEFFENINQRLQQYFQEYQVDRIAISCSKILIPYLYNAKVATPFDKKDERLFKIPRHIHTPIYEVLLDTNKFLQKGELIYEEANQELVESLLGGESGEREDDMDELF